MLTKMGSQKTFVLLLCLVLLPAYEVGAATDQKKQAEIRRQCATLGKGLKTIVALNKKAAEPEERYTCSSGRGDICIYITPEDKQKLCASSDQENLEKWSKEKASQIAGRVYRGVDDATYPLSQQDSGIYFSDPYGVLSPVSEVEPALPGGASRLVNITNFRGLDEALTGITGRVESVGMKLLEEGVPLSGVSTGDLGVAFDAKPHPNLPLSSTDKQFGEIVLFAQGGGFRSYGPTCGHVR